MMSGQGLTILLRRRGDGLEARLARAPAMPVEALLLGRPVAEARQLLGRLFGLCRCAHLGALDLALGLGAPDQASLAAEIRTDHLAQLFVHLPPLLGLAPQAPPRGDLEAALLGGAAERFAAGDLPGWLASGEGVSPLMRRIAEAFPPGEADPGLPPLGRSAAPRPGEALNVPAARVATHPVLAEAARCYGYGPLWQALGVVADLLALTLPGHLAAGLAAPSFALVPAARGTYALTVTASGGLLTRLDRLTPTDDLAAPGGAIERALARLAPSRHCLAPVVVRLLNPCERFQVEEVAHA